MHTRLLPVTLGLATLAVCLCTSWSTSLAASQSDPSPDQIEGKIYKLERAYYVVVHVPVADVDKVMKSVVAAVGLEYGNYDQVAYIDALGFELFRPLSGSKAGAQTRASRNRRKS